MFITLGVAAEVVVVIQNQNLFVGAMLLAIKDCRGQAAQAGTNHYQIIVFARLADLFDFQATAPGVLMRHGIRSWVATPEACEGRGICQRV